MYRIENQRLVNTRLNIWLDGNCLSCHDDTLIHHLRRSPVAFFGSNMCLPVCVFSWGLHCCMPHQFLKCIALRLTIPKDFQKNINQMSLFFHFLHCLFTFLLSTGGPCRCCTTGFGASEFVPTAPPRRAMGRKQKAAKEDGEEGGGGGGMHDIQGAWHGFAKFFFSGKKRFFLMRLQVLRDHLLG